MPTELIPVDSVHDIIKATILNQPDIAYYHLHNHTHLISTLHSSMEANKLFYATHLNTRTYDNKFRELIDTTRFKPYARILLGSTEYSIQFGFKRKDNNSKICCVNKL